MSSLNVSNILQHLKRLYVTLSFCKIILICSYVIYATHKNDVWQVSNSWINVLMNYESMCINSWINVNQVMQYFLLLWARAYDSDQVQAAHREIFVNVRVTFESNCYYFSHQIIMSFEIETSSKHIYGIHKIWKR